MVMESINFSNINLSNIGLSSIKIKGAVVDIVSTTAINHKNVPLWVRNYRPEIKINTCEDQPTNLIVIFDESGSVFDNADPILYRHELMLNAVKAFAKSCTCKKCTISVATFNTEALFYPKELSKHNLCELDSFINNLPYSNSQLSDSLSWAENQASLLTGTNILVVFSDFELFDRPEDNVYERFANFNGKSLAAVLRVEPNNELLKKQIDYIQIDTTSKNTAIADAVIEKINFARPNPAKIAPVVSINSAIKKRKSLLGKRNKSKN